jgi:hypothetical protein
VFVCVIVLIGVYWWANKPHYIELSVPAPGGDWSYTERTIQIWTDSGARYFIVRRETYAYGGECRDGYDTWESVVAHFDQWLTNHGWTEYGNAYDTPCNLFLPESQFLDYGENGYLVYKHLEAEPYTEAPTVCLAIWPIGYDIDGYHIVLVTGNPSWFTMLMDAFD